MTESGTGEAPLHYHDGGTDFAGVYRTHTTAAARGAVMIAPDWRGLSPFVRGEAERLAAAGFDAAVLDLYGGGLFATAESQSGPLISGLIEHRAQGVARMSAALAAFRSVIDASLPVVLIGYSIGGMVSLDFARGRADLAGVALCSALLKTAAPGSDASIAASVLIVHGTGDVVSPMSTVDALAAELDEAGSDATFVLYTGTHHAFYNPEAGTDPTARLVYSATADARARATIDSFLAGIAAP